VVESQLEGPRDEIASVTPEVPSAIPQDALIIVPVRNAVLFPGTVLPITIEQSLSVRAAQQAMREQRQIGVLMQKSAEIDEPLATRCAVSAPSPISRGTSRLPMERIIS